MDQGLIIGIIFFIVIAVFLLITLNIMKDMAEPSITVISSFMIGPALKNAMARKKGITGGATNVMQYAVILFVCAVIGFLIFYAVSDGFRSAINDFFSGFIDIVGIV